MLKNNLIVFSACIFCCCHSIDEKVGKIQTTKTSSIKKNNVTKAESPGSALALYKDCLAGLDTIQVNNVKAALNNYEAIFKGSAPEICDTGYLMFSSYYRSVVNYLTTQELSNYSILNTKRKKEYKTAMLSYGFEIAFAEGEPYYKPNRTLTNPFFYSFVSPQMKLFLEKEITETSNSLSAEGGINLAPEELVDRYIWWTKFEQDYQKFLLLKIVRFYSDTYRRILYEGTENTPFYMDNEINTYYKQAYRYLFSKYGNLAFTAPLKKFYENAALKN